MAYYEDIIETQDGNSVLCILCKISLENRNTAIELHISGEKHKKKYLQKILILNNVLSDCCLLCYVQITDLDHIQTSKHQGQLQEICNFVEKDGAFIELPSMILQPWASTEQGTRSHCTICDQFVGFTVKDIKSHIQSPTHMRSKAMALQPFNGIFSVDDNNADLWCKICQKYFANYIEKIFDHIDDSEHYVKLSKIVRLIEGQDIVIDNYLTNSTEDKATCNRCKTLVSCNIDNLERHIKGKRHKNA
ncbi:unnamed protein product [Pieris brassicae]|uniref:U1-type domain-containing protein n=1 Tax=Pieris brassicae TaxID=7116 RepID=A0A9P0TT48_PIEBR|nr:unnamed protein product [Pieris brassicae]